MSSGMVCSSQASAVEAGLALLRSGGNAVDAALATAACLTVTEPCSNGIGGDCFALVWDGERLHGLNASGRSPGGWTADRFAGLDAMPEDGWDTVTVPGQVAGWAALQQRFASRSLAACLAPAISAAEDGFAVTPVTARAWARGLERHGHRAAFRATFAVDGAAPAAGSTARLPDHGATLRRIAESDGQDFYHGELAATMVDAARAEGGALDLPDLAAHAVDWPAPLALDAAGVTGHELPPNGQGIAALAAAGVAEHLELDRFGPDDPQAIHLQVEAMKQAFVDLFAEAADPEHMRLPPADLISPARLAARAALVDPHRAGPMDAALPPSPGTVLLVTADAAGRMVAMIQSNYEGFGSGIVVPGTGISLHNRGCGFVTRPGHPNTVGPGKRPFHTIIPGFWSRDGLPLGPFGCMGAHMQCQGHLQLWQRIHRWGQEAQAALDAPRWRLEPDGSLELEQGFAPETAHELAARGHRIVWSPSTRFGGAQCILRRSDGSLVGATDRRKDGFVGLA